MLSDQNSEHCSGLVTSMIGMRLETIQVTEKVMRTSPGGLGMESWEDL